ncbi:MAG TPA: GNAT family N-acetyltransferase [Thermoanaerobaculia bacterium]
MPVDAPERFVVRAYEPGDETAILDLFARSFHQPLTPQAWRWRYEDNPEGGTRISVAFENDRLVAHYAGYPVALELDGEPLQANQIGDTMTDPSVRQVGRGPTSILARTATHFYETFCEGRVAFNYGFNVSNIQKFSMRFLRAERVEPVVYRARDLRLRPFVKLSRAERWARGISLEVLTTVSAEFDDLFRRSAHHYSFLVKRDARYVRWRYLDSPTAYHLVAIRKWRTLVGWLVFRMREDRFSLGDFFIDPAHVDGLEAAIRHLTSVVPATKIETWCPNRPVWLSNALQELGFEVLPEPQDLSLMCVPFARRDAANLMRARLFYTMGDGDLF